MPVACQFARFGFHRKGPESLCTEAVNLFPSFVCAVDYVEVTMIKMKM